MGSSPGGKRSGRTWALVMLAAGTCCLAACSSATPQPSIASSAPASATMTTPAPGLDVTGLVTAMWDQLGEASRQQVCDLFSKRGDEAGQLFVAGAEMDPKADLLSDADKAAISAEAAVLLAARCATS